MLQYNIDFFDFQLNNIHHDVVEGLDIDWDYLSPTESTIEVSKTKKVDVHDLIYIKGLNEFIGIVTKVSIKDYTTEITFKPFITLFDHDVIIDRRWQKSGSNSMPLETVIQNRIIWYWTGSNAYIQDLSGIMPADGITTTSSTKWNFKLKSDVDKGYRLATGLYEVLIAKAMSKHRIAVVPHIDFTNKKINITIGRVSGKERVIEADLDNVVVDTFTIKEASTSVNTLEIWHEGLTDKRYKDPPSVTYYKHKNGSWSTSSDDKIEGDEVKKSYTVTPTRNKSFEATALAKLNAIIESGTNATVLEISLAWGANGHLWREHYYLHKSGDPRWDTSATNRVLPAVFQLSSIDIDDDESFEDAAYEEAYNVFSGIEWSNLIELSMDVDDKMIKPTSFNHGQVFTIYRDHIGYSSILTGIKIEDDSITLSFGIVRFDLTKKLKKRR